MKQILLLMSILLVLAGLIATGRSASIAQGASVYKQICKTVTKNVPGTKKVKVCTTVKTASHPTATNTPRPTSTPVPTKTSVPVTTTIDPAQFALSSADVPSNVKILTSEVEPNVAADANSSILHFGSSTWGQEGRLTGYFWEAGITLTDVAGRPHTALTSYHVSIFGAAQQAATAWQAQRNGWISQDTTGGACGVGVGTLGERAFTCSDSFVSPSGNLVESYFKRGRLLIQVWTYTSYDDFTNYFDSVDIPAIAVARQIAVTLDARAAATAGNVARLQGYSTPKVDGHFQSRLHHAVEEQGVSSSSVRAVVALSRVRVVPGQETHTFLRVSRATNLADRVVSSLVG